MTNINEALDNIFSYKRNQRPVMERLVQQGYLVRGVGHLNVVAHNAALDIEGVISFIGTVDQRIGTQIAHYTAEKEIWGKDGKGTRLPEPFHHFADCPYIHYGVLLNCLAYLRGGVKKLSLVVMETNEVMTMMIKPAIAELFLWNIGKKTASKNASTFSSKDQTTLFQPARA